MSVRARQITTDNGYVIANYAGNNSITFFAELPKSAVVKTIKVNGSFIDDIGRDKIIEYPRERIDGKMREVCSVYFKGDIPQELFDGINSYTVGSFEVYYSEEAVIVE